MQINPPLIKPSTTEPLLYQVSMTYWRMQMYPMQSYPPVMESSGTEPYYTRSVWHSCIRSAWLLRMQIYILQNTIEKAVDMRFDLLNIE